MLKSILRKLGQLLLNATEEKKATPTTKTVITTNKNALSDSVRHNDKTIEGYLEDIQAQLIAKGYKAMQEILVDYKNTYANSENDRPSNPPKSVLMSFVIRQLASLGEKDEQIESYTDDMLITKAIELNRLQFVNRMREQGKAKPVSDKQLALIMELASKANICIELSTIKDTFDASDKIEFLRNKLGIEPSDNTKPSEKQLTSIINMAKLVHYEVAVDTIETREQASALIGTLSVEIGKLPNEASDKQKDYAKRLWKQLGHRMTAKKTEEIEAMTGSEISKSIKDMKIELVTLHPEINMASEGQINYIKQLCQVLMIPVPAKLDTLTKEGASKTLDKLNKQYLHLLSVAQGSPIDITTINKMDKITVTNLIKQIRLENTTKDFQKTSTEIEETNNEIPF